MKTRLDGRGSVAAWVLAVVGVSCASTKMTSTWTDPSARGAELSKVAVIYMVKDPSLRRIAEDTAAANLSGAQAVPSYRVLSNVDLQNREAVEQQLASHGFQGVLVMHLAGVSERVTLVGGPYVSPDAY